MTRPERASDQQIGAFVDAMPDWTAVDGGLVRTATAPTFAAGIGWVTQVAEVADRMDHHPDIDIRWRTVTFRLSTHDVGGITVLDFALAREIDGIVGREAEPAAHA